MNKNYLLMDDAELEKLGVVGYRSTINKMLRSKPYDIIMIILIVIYTLLIFLYFSVEDTTFAEKSRDIFYLIEIIILGLFSVEITMHIIALHSIYLKDPWNIFDLIIIILSILFVLLDIFVTTKAVRSILKIRGLFRIVRIFILIRKLNTLRVKREV